MKINFTLKQYLALVEALETASFPIGIMSDFAEEEERRTAFKNKIKALDELKSHVFAHGKDFGQEALFEADKVDSRTYLKDEYTDRFGMDTIFDFEDWVVFDRMVRILAERDVRELFPEKTDYSLKDEQVFNALEQFEQKYTDEFNESGYQNLRISFVPTKQ